MKTYTVRHREGGGGEICETEVEAGSREELFGILKARKITAISVSEGGASGRRAGRRAGRPRPGLAKGVVAGIVVVVGALGAFWWLTRGEPAGSGEDEAKPRPGKIAEKASAAPRPKAAAPVREAAPKPPKPQRVGEIRDGKMLMVDGRLRTMSKHAVTTTVARISVADRTFERSTDRMLAHILEMEPGETLIGDSALLYKGFDKEFVKSLDTPIIYDKDDDVYVKELKAGVLALRQELKERMAAGEDINAVLAETRDQMQELGLYRQELKEQVVQLTQDRDLSQEDYDTIIQAANKMLEERGSKPLELPTAVKHRLKIWKTQNENGNENEKGDNK